MLNALPCPLSQVNLGWSGLRAPRAARRRALDELVAPDFTLPNLVGGGLTSLSDHRSKKRLLIAFSSW